eukprot:TRINITY_DN23806_c0_g1_i1.p1 TRINITY_DN23806_c0_g1~~TRINITY_DN23806_c0_g1_i1.p1  ORF type:complete len:1435 (+),score=412.96 TRINITY_DN23806_c0_g1_i1:91-4395(+)
MAPVNGQATALEATETAMKKFLNGKSAFLRFAVNGVWHRLPEKPGEELDPELTVLEWLRDRGLTGTKLVCGEGGCGACSVVCTRRDHTGKLSHSSVNACLATMGEMDGAHITTVEGLANEDASVLHPIQQAISDSHGSQCGYCTPGMVMAMYGLWMNSKTPTVADIEESFDGNLCRCTGYRPILHSFQPFASDYKELKASGEVLDDEGPLQKKACEGKKTSCCGGRTVPANLGDKSIKWAEKLEAKYDLVFKQLQEPRSILLSGSHYSEGCEWARPISLHDAAVLAGTRTNVRFQVGNTERRIEKFFKWNHVYPLTLVSLSQVKELLGISWTDTEVRLGGATPLNTINAAFAEKQKVWGKEDPRGQVLQSYCAILKWFAGTQIRNVAGLGGNIATASPISDLNPCHVAAGAHLEVASLDEHGKVTLRKVLMGDMEKLFFCGYRKTALGPRDIIVALTLPFPKKDGSEFFQAYKMSRRRDDDLAIVNAAMRVKFDGAGASAKVSEAAFAFGGMGPFTKACGGLSKWWKGKEWTHANFSASIEELSKDLPLPDGAPGGMSEYRRALARSFYFKFWTQVAYLRSGKAPPAPLEAKHLSAALDHSTSGSYHKPPQKGLQHFSRDQQNLMEATGTPDKHRSGDMHASGHAKYLDDIEPARNELYAHFVCSTKAHAKILKIDASKAQEVPGFVDLVTAEDIRGKNITGPLATDEEAMASKEVHYLGQVIATVCATSKHAARLAAKLVKVEYEELPSVIGLEDAIEQKSFHPLFFQQPGDLEAEIHNVDAATVPGGSSSSTVDAALEAARKDPSKYVVVEGEVFIGPQEHFYLETHATRVEPNENGEYVITSSTQNPAETQLLVSKALGVSLNKVTSTVKRIGGGFGGKESRACVLSIPAAVAAQKLRRPVRFHLDRDVDQLVGGQAPSFVGKYSLALEKGTNKAVVADIHLYTNAGWALDLSQPMLNRGMLHCTNACRVPSTRVRGHICKTNTPSTTALRGFGGPQGMYVAETMLAHGAKALGVPRETVLQTNLYSPLDKNVCNMPMGEKVPLKKMWEQLMKQSDFQTRQAAVDDFNRLNRYKKRGLAAVPTAFGISYTATHLNQSGALVHLQKDGTVLVAHGGVEMGQGLHTKLARVAASILDLPLEAVFIKETSTDTVANGVATAASSGTDLNGGAVMNACNELKERLKPFLEKHKLETNGHPPTDAQRIEQMAKAAGSAWFARVNLTAQGYHRSPIKGINWNQKGVNEMQGDPFWYYTYGVACSEVEIDCLTGDLTTLRSDVVHDVGRSINTAVDMGQVEGAFVQGMGLFTVEETTYMKDGNLFSKGPGLYKIPGFGDTPRDFRVRLLENSEGPPVMGSKAVGEPPLFLGCSVLFAAREAIYSARRDFAAEAGTDVARRAAEEHFRLDAPATCEKIRMACLDFINPTGHRSHWHARV